MLQLNFVRLENFFSRLKNFEMDSQLSLKISTRIELIVQTLLQCDSLEFKNWKFMRDIQKS